MLLPGRGADRQAAWPGRSRGGAAGRPRPFPLAFQKAEKKKKNGSRSRTREGAQGQGPGQPGDGGGGSEGDPSKRGKRDLQSEKEAAGGTEVGALRLTKPAEGAALWLPVLRAPPREPRSPATPSGSPAPPPLWEATWTRRFGPSAKSQLQGGGSPPPRSGFPVPLRLYDRRLSVRGMPLKAYCKALGRWRGHSAGWPGRGAHVLWGLGASERPKRGLPGGRSPGKVPARREGAPGAQARGRRV